MPDRIASGYIETEIDYGNNRLHFEGKNAGKTIDFIYHRRTYKICFPNFDFAYTSFSSGPEVTFDGTASTGKWLWNWDKFRDAQKYGIAYDYSLRSKKIKNIAIQKLIVRSANPVSSRTARAMKKDLRSWKKLFIIWLQIETFSDFRVNVSEFPFPARMLSKYISVDDADNIRDIRTVQDELYQLFDHYPLTITDSQLKSTLVRSSNGQFPPEYYSQLIQALLHYNDGNYRQCAFDCSTAFEMSLFVILRARLKNHSEDEKDRIFKKFREINGLIQGLKIWGGIDFSQNDAETIVSNPRNKAIHEGAVVTQDQALNSLNYVHDFIYPRLPVD